jgi:polyferredoxin
MDEAPKRSPRDTITQLVVIAILIAILIVAIIFFRQYVDSHNALSVSHDQGHFLGAVPGPSHLRS